MSSCRRQVEEQGVLKEAKNAVRAFSYAVSTTAILLLLIWLVGTIINLDQYMGIQPLLITIATTPALGSLPEVYKSVLKVEGLFEERNVESNNLAFGFAGFLFLVVFIVAWAAVLRFLVLTNKP